MVDTTKPYFPHNWQTGYFIDTKGGLDPKLQLAPASPALRLLSLV